MSIVARPRTRPVVDPFTFRVVSVEGWDPHIGPWHSFIVVPNDAETAMAFDRKLQAVLAD